MSDTATVDEEPGFHIDLEPPDDSQIPHQASQDTPDLYRNRWTRRANLLASTVISFGLPMALCGMFGAIWGGGEIGSLIGFALGGVLAGIILPRRVALYGREWTATVTQNIWTGKMVVYGPGLHASLLWEERAQEGNYSLKPVNKSLSVPLSTTDSQVIIKVEYSYAMDLLQLTRAIAADEATIDKALAGYIESFLTVECATKSSKEVRESVREFNIKLNKLFQAIGGPLEKLGFITVSLIISGVALPPAVQKTKDAKQEMRDINELLAESFGLDMTAYQTAVTTGRITPKMQDQRLNRMMIIAEQAKGEIKILEVDGGLSGLAAEALDQFSSGSGNKKGGK